MSGRGRGWVWCGVLLWVWGLGPWAAPRSPSTASGARGTRSPPLQELSARGRYGADPWTIPAHLAPAFSGTAPGEAAAADGNLPGGMSPEQLAALSSNPEMMALLEVMWL